MSICLNPTSAAGKRYTRGVALTMIGYMFAVLGTTTYVRNHHPQGIEVYFLAALPALCILGMLIVMAIYLRDEKDEFQRMLIVRSLLWATFATLALSAYNDLLISYESPHTPALLPVHRLLDHLWSRPGRAIPTSPPRSQ